MNYGVYKEYNRLVSAFDCLDWWCGLAVSVTTEGFISNLGGLEGKISDNFLFNEFCGIRNNLSGDKDKTGLELKSSGKGILA